MQSKAFPAWGPLALLSTSAQLHPQLGIFECSLLHLLCQWLLQPWGSRDWYNWYNWTQRCHRRPDRLCCVLVNPCLPSALRFLQEYWLFSLIHTDIWWSIVYMPQCMQSNISSVTRSMIPLCIHTFALLPQIFGGSGLGTAKQDPKWVNLRTLKDKLLFLLSQSPKRQQGKLQKK